MTFLSRITNQRRLALCDRRREKLRKLKRELEVVGENWRISVMSVERNTPLQMQSSAVSAA